MYEMKTMELICGDFARKGPYFQSESMTCDILTAFKVGKVLSEEKSTKRPSSLLQRFSSRVADNGFGKEIDSEEGKIRKPTYTPITCRDEDMMNPKKNNKQTKQGKQKLYQMERENILAEFEGILCVSAYEKSPGYIIVEVTCINDYEMDYDWFKRSAKWFYQSESLKRYRI